MSSESILDDHIAMLISVEAYIYRFGGVVFMVFGSISCILTLIVFTQKNLRKNPCSIYLLACNIANFLYIYSSILSSTLSNGYNIKTISHSLTACRLVFYMAFLFDCLSPFYLILASIDRILITSPKALTRRRSTRRLAYICIICGTLFWMLFHSHALVFTDILQLTPNSSLCYFQAGLYTVLMGYYSLIIKGILVPILLIIFGVWTFRNIRSVRIHRVVAVRGAIRRDGGLNFIQSKDRQFILMLLMDIIIYILFTSMLSVVVVYQQITQNARLSVEQTQIDLFVRNVAVFSTFIPFCIGCCGYLLVSKTFRREVKKILLCQ
jgi:hypothetical protein